MTPQFPVAMYHPDSQKPERIANARRYGNEPEKILHANNQAELNRLLAIGWKVKEPQKTDG